MTVFTGTPGSKNFRDTGSVRWTQKFIFILHFTCKNTCNMFYIQLACNPVKSYICIECSLTETVKFKIQFASSQLSFVNFSKAKFPHYTCRCTSVLVQMHKDASSSSTEYCISQDAQVSFFISRFHFVPI